MAYIQTYGGGFNKDAQGNLTAYQAPGAAPAGGGAPQLNEQSNMFGGFDAGSQSANAAQGGLNQALNFINSLPGQGGAGSGVGGPAAKPLIPGLPQNPYQTNPTGTDMIGGTQGLNPRNFATLDTANTLAKALGANVTATNYDDAMRSPEYNLDFGRGAGLNAGLLAGRYNTNDPTRDKFWDSEYWRNKALEDELRYTSSPMEDEIRNDRSGQMGQIYKDVPGGYQSFAPGGSAGSFSDASHWKTTGPAGQTFLPGGSNANLVNSAGQLFSGTNWMQRLPGGGGPGGPGAGGGNPFAGTGGPTPPPPSGGGQPFGGWGSGYNPMTGGGMGGGFNPFSSFMGGGSPFGAFGGFGMGGQNPLSSFASFLNGGGFGAQQPGSRGFQRRPYLPGYGGGLGYGARFSNAGYYPQFGM